MYKVIVCTEFDKLPKELQGVYCDMDKYYYNVLYIEWNGKVIFSEQDRGEPEDNSFVRDYSWIKQQLEEAYNLGRLHSPYA